MKFKLKKILLPLLVLVTLMGIFFMPKFIKINKIDCVSQFGVCNSLITNSLTNLVGKDLSILRKDLAKILSAQVLVKKFDIKFKIPDRVILNIIEEKPEIALYDTQNNIFALVNNAGKIIAFKDDSQLPHLKVESIPKSIGEIVDRSMLFSIKLQIELLLKYGIKNSTLTKEALFVNIQSYEVIFPTDGDIDLLLGSLNLLLSRLNTEASGFRIKTIDLRYKNPVLR